MTVAMLAVRRLITGGHASIDLIYRVCVGLHLVTRMFTRCHRRGLGYRVMQSLQLHLRAHGPGRAGEDRQPKHQEEANALFHGI
jgi:hypothetical protein